LGRHLGHAGESCGDPGSFPDHSTAAAMLYQCLQLMRRWLRGAEQGVKSGQPFLDAIPGSCDQNSLERGKKPLKSAGERYICQKQYLLGTQGDSAARGPIQIQTACCAEKQFQWLSRVRRERK